MTVDPEQLQQALQFVRPRLRGHAGDMTATVTDDGDVTIEFYGACEHCPSMAVTYAGLVQSYVEAVPGVRSVSVPQRRHAGEHPAAPGSADRQRSARDPHHRCAPG